MALMRSQRCSLAIKVERQLSGSLMIPDSPRALHAADILPSSPFCRLPQRIYRRSDILRDEVDLVHADLDGQRDC